MHHEGMRTTIEIDDDVRAVLLQRAAERGERGYSELINEILKRHLGIESRAIREERARKVQSLSGSISEETAQQMREAIERSRTQWRNES